MRGYKEAPDNAEYEVRPLFCTILRLVCFVHPQGIISDGILEKPDL